MTTPLSRRRMLAHFAALPLGLAACRNKPAPFSGYALVVTGQERSLAVVDLAGFTLAGRIPFPTAIRQVLHQPSSRMVYALSAEDATVYAFDWAGRTITGTLSLGQKSLHAAFSQEADALWVLLADPPSAVRISLPDFRVHTRIPLASTPVSFDVSPYQPHLAASLESGGIAFVPDTANPSPELLRETEQFGLVAFRSDGRQLIAANHTGLSLSFVRGIDRKSVVDLPINTQARHFCFKPDGGQLFVTDGESDLVTIVYPYSTEVDRPVLAGASPGAMVACANPPYLLVANRASSDVSILALETGKLVAVVPVGAAPCHLSITPDNQYALALNQSSGDMAVIRLSAMRNRRTKTAPLFTMVPVGEAPHTMAVIAS